MSGTISLLHQKRVFDRWSHACVSTYIRVHTYILEQIQKNALFFLVCRRRRLLLGRCLFLSSSSTSAFSVLVSSTNVDIFVTMYIHRQALACRRILDRPRRPEPILCSSFLLLLYINMISNNSLSSLSTFLFSFVRSSRFACHWQSSCWANPRGRTLLQTSRDNHSVAFRRQVEKRKWKTTETVLFCAYERFSRYPPQPFSLPAAAALSLLSFRPYLLTPICIWYWMSPDAIWWMMILMIMPAIMSREIINLLLSKIM